ncbi:MAG: AraC family transcriptional regulator [Betaproteobacteria bacterium]|nr:AraC family transcriptional regulator [Betaproteobacteria bacterium]
MIRTMNADKYKNDAHKYGIDAFSQILQLLKLNVSIYHNAKVCGNWSIKEHTLGATCFHMVTTGNCVLDVPEHFNGVLSCGDLVIFPRELAHSMIPTTPLQGAQRHLDYRMAQDIEGTGLICGEMRFQHKGSRYILDALPPVFVIRHDSSNDWLGYLLKMILVESLKVGPASKVIIDKLSELLFTYALRQYLTDKPGKAGILAIYAHPRITNAIDAIHRRPDHEWTLESMAKEAALSRTSFAETFKSVSGWTAGQYLIWWRMQLAWSLLSDGESIAEVSNKVGYKSEAAFSRIFQKMFSTTAGKVRRGNAT